jgi:RNA polymerase sigma-54 factor
VNRSKGQKKSQEKDWIEQIPEQTEVLPEHLLSQLDVKTLTKNVVKAFHFYANHLDANGYLSIDTGEAAKIAGVSLEDAREALAQLQALEPAGIGARSLQECLLIQIKRDKSAPELAARLLESHFLEFAEKKWRGLAKTLDVTMQDIQQVSDYVQTLNPRPGSAFHHERPQYIVPDLLVKNEQQGLTLYLVDGYVPKVRLNKDYSNRLAPVKDAQVNHFLKEKTQEYRWIQKSIESRKETLLKVGHVLLEKQRDFFLHGKGHLKPLTMKEVSEEIGMHESTVSRAVREKFIQTPQGTFPLKQFFSSAVPLRNGSGEEAASSVQIKNTITRLIEGEDKKKPLSDQILATLLNQEGYEISRRTVAKYREQLKIPSSSKRKRYE